MLLATFITHLIKEFGNNFSSWKSIWYIVNHIKLIRTMLSIGVKINSLN